MTTYGVTPAGFVRKPLSQIITDLKTRIQARFGNNADLRDEQPFGQLVADISAIVDEPWQIAEDVYFSFDPDNASGLRLIAIAAITGTVPKTPTKSTVQGVAIGTNGSIVPLHTQFQVTGNGPMYQSTSDETITTLTPWSTYIASVGDLRTNAGNVYRCIVPGLTAASGGPTTTSINIVDNVAHWQYLGAGTAAVYVPTESLLYGAYPAPAYSMSIVVNPVSGLLSFTNPVDATLGQTIETDAQFRTRRIAELTAQGEGGVESMRADLLQVNGVTDALIYENVGDTTDINSRPPHSVEAVVLGGADADVAAVVFTKGAGIQTYGGTSISVTDSMGNAHTINFSRPNPINIYVVVHITKNANYPVDGDAQVKQAIVDWSVGALVNYNLGAGLRVGDPVITAKIEAAIMLRVPGIADLTALFIGTAPSPTSGANITVGVRDLAKFDTSRIAVTSI